MCIRGRGRAHRDTQVVNSGKLIIFFQSKDFINTKKKSFFGEVKDSVVFPFFFYLISFINLCSPLVTLETFYKRAISLLSLTHARTHARARSRHTHTHK